MDEDWVPIEGAFGTLLALGGAGTGDLVKLDVKREPKDVRGVGSYWHGYYRRGVVCRIGELGSEISPERREGELRTDVFVAFGVDRALGGIWAYPEEVIAWKPRKEKS